MESEPRYSLGDAQQLAYDTYLADWRRVYAAHVAREDLLAGPVTTVLIQTVIFNGGRANITVTVNARRRHQTDVGFFRLTRHGGLWSFDD
jgi:hypothetical protein